MYVADGRTTDRACLQGGPVDCLSVHLHLQLTRPQRKVQCQADPLSVDFRMALTLNKQLRRVSGYISGVGYRRREQGRQAEVNSDIKSGSTAAHLNQVEGEIASNSHALTLDQTAIISTNRDDRPETMAFQSGTTTMHQRPCRTLSVELRSSCFRKVSRLPR